MAHDVYVPDLARVEPSLALAELNEVDAYSPVKDKVRALLVDIDPLVSQWLLRMVAACKQLDIAFVPCRTAEEAMAELSRGKFDVVFVEYWLGCDTSIPFIHEVAKRRIAPCVLLTDLNEPDIRRLAFRAGAEGFLSKDALCPQALESVAMAVLRARMSAGGGRLA